jgi:hypothetical protein
LFSRYGMQYDFEYHDYIFPIWFVSEQVVVKFDMPSTCNVSHLIVDLVTHIGLEAEQHGGGSEVLVRAWDRLANKAVFFYPISILYNYLLLFMASTNPKQNSSALIFINCLWRYMLYAY